jgi:hypothetical protein
MAGKSSSNNQTIFCVVMGVVICILIYLMFFRESDCKQKVVIPLANGKVAIVPKSVAEKWDSLSQPYGSPAYQNKEGFYVSRDDYVPSTQTESEYTPMLSLYNPKNSSRAPTIPAVDSVTDPSKLPAVPPIPNVPMPLDTKPKKKNEPYGNVWIPEGLAIDPSNPKMKLIADYDKQRSNDAKMSPFFMNNSGDLMYGELVQ